MKLKEMHEKDDLTHLEITLSLSDVKPKKPFKGSYFKEEVGVSFKNIQEE